MTRSRYSKWDNTQRPLDDEVDVAQVLDEMSEELLSGYGGHWSLRELHRRGMQGRSGLDSMLGRLRRTRREWAERTNLSGPLQQVREELDNIIGLERAELADKEGDEAQLKQVQLDALPRHPAGALRELQNYDFSSSEAKARYDALVEKLRQEVLDSYFKSLMGSMQSVTPEDVARIKDMMAELNEMIAARDRGDDVDFDGFMSRYGDMFPENPKNLDELLEILARRMAAMSRLMASLSPQQRAELQELTESVLSDLDLAWEMDQLNQNMRELMPHLPWDEVSPNMGDQEMPMSEAVDAIERVSEMEELEQTMSGDYAGATLEDIDEDQVRRALDEDAVEDLQWLKKIERALEEAGVVNRTKGRLELTARGARMIGERSLTRVLDRIRREPSHRARGGQAEPTGQTKPWTFGDSDPISVERTVYNAVLRSGPGRAVKLAPGRLRGRRNRIPSSHRDRTAARPLVLDAAARALDPGQANGARAQCPDRRQVPAGQPLPRRLLRLRASHGGLGPSVGGLGGRSRHEHGACVHARRPRPRRGSSFDQTGHHGHGRRANSPPRRRLCVVQLAPHPRDHREDAQAGHASGSLEHLDQRLHAGHIARLGGVHGPAVVHHRWRDLPGRQCRDRPDGDRELSQRAAETSVLEGMRSISVVVALRKQRRHDPPSAPQRSQSDAGPDQR